jgi:hypothetical protein
LLTDIGKFNSNINDYSYQNENVILRDELYKLSKLPKIFRPIKIIHAKLNGCKIGDYRFTYYYYSKFSVLNFYGIDTNTNE